MNTEKIIVKFDFTVTKEFANIIANLKKIEQMMVAIEEKIYTLSSNVETSLMKGIQIMDAFFSRVQKMAVVDSIAVINDAIDAIKGLTETIKNQQCCPREGKADNNVSTHNEETETSWWDDLKKYAQIFVEIVDFIDAIKKSVGYYKKIKELFGKAIDKTKNLVPLVDKGLSHVISRAINLVLLLSSLLSEGLPGIFLRLSGVFVNFGRAISALFTTNPIGMLIFMITLLVQLVILNFNTIKMYVKKLFSYLVDVFQKIWTPLKDGLAPVIDFLLQKFEEAKIYLIDLSDVIAEIFSNVWTSLKDGLAQAIDSLFQKFEEAKIYLSGVCDTIAAIFSNVWTSIKEGFFEAIGAINDGIKNFSFKDIFGWVGSTSDAINQASVASNSAVVTAADQTKTVQTNNQLSVHQNIVTNDPKAAAELSRRNFEREVKNVADNQGGALAY